MEARSRYRRHKPPVIRGRKDHHRVLAMYGDALWSEFERLPDDLAEMRFGVLKLPGRKRVVCPLRGSFERVRMALRLAHAQSQSFQTSLTKIGHEFVMLKPAEFSPEIPLQFRCEFPCNSSARSAADSPAGARPIRSKRLF